MQPQFLRGQRIFLGGRQTNFGAEQLLTLYYAYRKIIAGKMVFAGSFLGEGVQNKFGGPLPVVPYPIQRH